MAPSAETRKHWRAVAVVSVAALLGAALLGVLARFPWPSSWSIREPGLLLGALGVAFLLPLAYAARFRYLLGLRGPAPSFSIVAQVHYADRFLGAVLPFRLNLPAKAVLLQRTSTVALDVSLSVTILDYALEAAASLSIALLGAPVAVKAPLLLGLTVLGLVAAFLVLTPERLERWAGRLRPDRYGHRVVMFLHGLRFHTGEMLRAPRLLGVLPFLALIQLLLLVTFDLTVRSVGYGLSWWTLLVVANAGVIIGGLTPWPSGLVTREVALMGLLQVAGVPAERGLLAAVLFRALLLAPMAAGYGFLVRIGWRWGEWKRMAAAPPQQPPGS